MNIISVKTVWIQIRPNVLLGLILVQTVCKGYQQTAKVQMILFQRFFRKNAFLGYWTTLYLWENCSKVSLVLLFCFLTLYLLAGTRHLLITFTNSLDPDQAPDLDSNFLTLLIVLLKDYFEKKSQQMTKNHEKITQHAKSWSITLKLTLHEVLNLSQDVLAHLSLKLMGKLIVYQWL